MIIRIKTNTKVSNLSYREILDELDRIEEKIELKKIAEEIKRYREIELTVLGIFYYYKGD